MQLSDIETRLISTLAKRTDSFSTKVDVSTLTYDDINKECTCTTSSNNTLEVGNSVFISGAKAPYAVNTMFRKGNTAVAFTSNINQAIDRTVEISGANQSDYNGVKTIVDFPVYLIDTITVSSSVATVTTIENHGIQLDANLQIEISGAKQDKYNRVYTVTSIPALNQITFDLNFNISDAEEKNGEILQFSIVANKYNVAFEVDNTPITPATGSIFVLKDFQEGFNGIKEVTDVISSSQFKYSLDADFESPAQGTIEAKYDFRITGSATLESSAEHYQTKDEKPWIYITLDDETTSRSKSVQNDADVMVGNGNTFFETVYQTINLYVFTSTGEQQKNTNVLGRLARDLSLQLKPAIYKAIAGYRFPSELSESTYQPCVPISNGTEAYERGYYIHRYSFMSVGMLYDADYIDNPDVVRLQEMYFNIDNTGLEVNPTF